MLSDGRVGALQGGVKCIKQRKNGVLFNNQRMWWGWGRGGGKATAAADYLTMGEFGGWGGQMEEGGWELDTCGGVGIFCKNGVDHLLQSQTMELRRALQPSPKMLMVYR